jgi:hypothetical protein
VGEPLICFGDPERPRSVSSETARSADVPSVIGNAVGGILLVALLNYGQVAPEKTGGQPEPGTGETAMTEPSFTQAG